MCFLNFELCYIYYFALCQTNILLSESDIIDLQWDPPDPSQSGPRLICANTGSEMRLWERIHRSILKKFWIFCMIMVKYHQIYALILFSPLECSKKKSFCKSLILANFKDFNVEASFLGPMAIVIPFWKPLVITFQMPPSYRPQKQWLNSNYYWAKAGKKCNFLFILQFFSECGKFSPKTNVLSPGRETCGNGPGTLKFCSEILNGWDFGGAHKTKYVTFIT